MKVTLGIQIYHLDKEDCPQRDSYHYMTIEVLRSMPPRIGEKVLHFSGGSQSEVRDVAWDLQSNEVYVALEDYRVCDKKAHKACIDKLKEEGWK